VKRAPGEPNVLFLGPGAVLAAGNSALVEVVEEAEGSLNLPP